MHVTVSGTIGAFAAITIAAMTESIRAQPPEPTTATAMVLLNAPVDEAFALFDPFNRSKWDSDWEIEVVSPKGAQRIQAGLVFRRLTDPQVHWKIERLDRRAHVVEFSYAKPKLYDMTVRIHCEAAGGTTRAVVTYAGVGKSQHASAALDHQLAHQIEDMIHGEQGWQNKINHYLEHGTRMRSFEPLAIERRHTIEFTAPPDEIFELMNPADGNHWTASTPKYVFGSRLRPSGAMWAERDGWMAVADYDTHAMHMTTVLYIPDVEFMIEQVRCEATPTGGTTVTITWRVAGISAEGNDAVQAFFDQHWDMRMNMIETTYRDVLAKDVN